jgi:HTH-type transcriptional regulator, cell division transcriptional repressor
MSNSTEKQLFSDRLKKALSKANYPVSPTVLSKEFNARYTGAPISVQSANNWLQGKAIPNQDKLLILSIWLNVTNQWLRFGDEDIIISDLSHSSKTNDLVNHFLKLNEKQKEIILSIMREFNS